ncbi:MAG: AtpZ/AtpI family protein [Candidatus Taylorbacteria bacterium]|nr:AtpZ/AtpI family protein [Candidatus Taylorbacteria bacterium]
MSETKESNQEADKREAKQFKAWALAGELGYTIAIPIVVFALLGRLADKSWGTGPWLLLLGIVMSILISTWLVYRKTIDILK